MYTRNVDPNVITKKQLCYDFYNSWKWPKITFNSFYQQYRGGKSMEEAIQPRVYTKRKKPYSWVRAKEMERYDWAQEPKATKDSFRNRLILWYPKEKAVLVWEAWREAKAEKQRNTPVVVRKPVQRQPKTIKKEDLTRYMIDITYPKEVARVFRKVYQDMIAQIEWELTYTEEKTQVAELNDKLTRLEWELEIFNSYNK